MSINAFVFHILVSGEPGLPGRKNVWSAITRPSVRPTVTALPGIRSFFCFRVAGPDVLAYRELSCRCRCCIEHRWTDCKSEDAGAWKRVVMSNTPANASTRTRGARQNQRAETRHCASCKADEMIAMESADDAQGFSFWLARAKGPAYKHTGEREEKDGRTLIPNTWYIDVCYYERFPLNFPSTFKFAEKMYTERGGCDCTQHCRAESAGSTKRSTERRPATLLPQSDHSW